jgi:hypothetical protein
MSFTSLHKRVVVTPKYFLVIPISVNSVEYCCNTDTVTRKLGSEKRIVTEIAPAKLSKTNDSLIMFWIKRIMKKIGIIHTISIPK